LVDFISPNATRRKKENILQPHKRGSDQSAVRGEAKGKKERGENILGTLSTQGRIRAILIIGGKTK
jgi:hypothetical protein